MAKLIAAAVGLMQINCNWSLWTAPLISVVMGHHWWHSVEHHFIKNPPLALCYPNGQMESVLQWKSASLKRRKGWWLSELINLFRLIIMNSALFVFFIQKFWIKIRLFWLIREFALMSICLLNFQIVRLSESDTQATKNLTEPVIWDVKSVFNWSKTCHK